MLTYFYSPSFEGLFFAQTSGDNHG
nr:hypothetical protein [Pseudescherichia vulneris]